MVEQGTQIKPVGLASSKSDGVIPCFDFDAANCTLSVHSEGPNSRDSPVKADSVWYTSIASSANYSAGFAVKAD